MGRSVDICSLVYFINQIKRLVVGKKMGEDKMRGEEGSVFLWSPVRRSKGKGQTGDSLVAVPPFLTKLLKLKGCNHLGKRGQRAASYVQTFCLILDILSSKQVYKN